ncbi:recA bacterial DNA recombination protein [Vibrio phage 1.215.B._10N.222.54.F7]|nr:recA bacterial DNA recombination protein [Vibrio phage 1.215.A._10N.222.54.F7]AUR96121.1 recA bacterial DNA recombination protein [Vibrio phage 1.215.B._10N.222.54.F7]
MASTADIIKQVNKSVGSNAAKLATDFENCQRIPTGVFELDYITGGGVPRGRVSIFFGFESSNKTNLALLTARNDMLLTSELPEAKRKKWLMVDIENSFDQIWAKRMGVPLDQLIVVKPDYAEQTIDIIDAFLQADDLNGIIVDSIAMLMPEAEAENSAERVQVGGNALLVTKLMRFLTRGLTKAAANDRYPTVICINQIRHKIGVNFGNPETMAGGNAVRFQSGLTLRLNSKDKIIKAIDPNMAVAKTTSAIIKKAKIPYLSANTEFDLCMRNFDTFSIGQSMDHTFMLAQLKDLGWLVRAGNKWEYGGETFAKQDEVIAMIYEDPDYLETVKQSIIKTRMIQIHGEECWVDYEPKQTA